MIATIIISLMICLLMIGSILFKPYVQIKGVQIGTYWIITLIGAIILVCCGLVSLNDICCGLVSSDAINPLKVLTIFICITMLSVFLDEIGFFKFMANFVLKKAGSNQIKLFCFLYLTVAILTIFTSNDIIILTFTPFVCAFCKNAKIDPIPYLFGEFVAANTWSMFLIIGNPTNIYLATSLNIDFITYVENMCLPTVLAGVVSFVIMFLLFRKKLLVKIEDPLIEEIKIEDKKLLFIGIIHLVVCIIGLSISSYIGIEMWIIALACTISLFIIVLIYRLVKKEKPVLIIECVKRAPWELIPFVLSMFVIVLALNAQGVTEKIYEVLNVNYSGLVYGTTSALMANVLNNIPMSVLYSSIIECGAIQEATFGTIIGSNIGAFLTPVGALAGIMWSNILRKHDVKFSHKKFVCYGTIIGIPTIVIACLGLLI